MNINNLKIDASIIDKLNINREHKSLLNELISENDPNKIELKAKSMLPESEYSSFDGSEERERNDLFKRIKCEVYKFLCTNDPSYSNERNSASAGIIKLIPLLAAAIAGSIGLAVGITTAIVTALIMAAIKIGRNAWCANNSNACQF